MDEPLTHATASVPSVDNADSSLMTDKRGVTDMIKPDQVEGIQKSGTKKLKIDTDKGSLQNVPDLHCYKILSLGLMYIFS